MILGEYSPGIFFQVSSLLIAITIIIIYYINQYLEHDKPFPYTYISQVARHYPEYVFFRIATISGSVLIALGWFVNHFYLKTIAYEKVININKYKPSVILILGMMGAFLLMGSTANIDTGKQNTDWHVTCAGYFFYVTMIAQLLNTALYMKLSFSFNAVSRNLVYLKMIQSMIIIIELYLNQVNNIELDSDLGKVSGVVLEWVSAYTILAGYYIQSLDVYNFKFVYEKNQAQHKKQDISVHQMMTLQHQ